MCKKRISKKLVTSDPGMIWGESEERERRKKLKGGCREKRTNSTVKL